MDRKAQKQSNGFSFSTARTAGRNDLSFNPEMLKEGSLVSKVSLLACVSALFLAFGSYFGLANELNLWMALGSAIVTFGGLFLLRSLNTAPLAVAGLAVWNSFFGVTVGWGLHSYVVSIGANTVIACILASAFAMAVVGAIGALSGIDFRGMERFLLLGLFGLILVAIAQFFLHMAAGVNIFIAVAGLVIFTGFFLVDFCRLARSGDNSWGEAADITINIVLDYVNFTFYLLRLVRELKK